eukprot:scaffold313093_cov23-Prasinocladus_malaysianus.AAC.1
MVTPGTDRVEGSAEADPHIAALGGAGGRPGKPKAGPHTITSTTVTVRVHCTPTKKWPKTFTTPQSRPLLTPKSDNVPNLAMVGP